MVALNFKPQFAGPVELRIKRQSIRRLGKKPRFHVGDPIQLYTGMRQKSCRKLVEIDPVIVEVSSVVIGPDCMLLAATYDCSGMGIDGRELSEIERHQMAVADGFDNWMAFENFFADQAPLPPFYGQLIRWDWK